jgi:hypothetical protein
MSRKKKATNGELPRQERLELPRQNRPQSSTTHEDEPPQSPPLPPEKEDQADSGPDRDNPITVRSGGTS